MGQRASNTATITFNETEIPADHLIGEENKGFKLAMTTLDRTRPGVAALAVGIARAAFEFATDYSQQRVQFGVPIAMHQAIQFMIADMATKVHPSRLVTWNSAVLLDQGRRNTIESSHAKRFAADAAMEVTTDAVQVYGGYGFIKDYPVEKLMRDAKIMQLYEGTSQIQRLVIARETLLPRRSKSPPPRRSSAESEFAGRPAGGRARRAASAARSVRRAARDIPRPEGAQVIRRPLHVDQARAAGLPEPRHERGECDLRGVRAPVELRLRCEQAADLHAVQAAGERAVRGPDLDGVRPAEHVQLAVGRATRARDPAAAARGVGAARDDVLERRVDRDRVAEERAPQRAADVDAVERHDPARVRAPPAEQVVVELDRHREHAARYAASSVPGSRSAPSATGPFADPAAAAGTPTGSEAARAARAARYAKARAVAPARSFSSPRDL